MPSLLIYRVSCPGGGKVVYFVVGFIVVNEIVVGWIMNYTMHSRMHRINLDFSPQSYRTKLTECDDDEEVNEPLQGE